jgi:HTH-type transcriptional regulator/antitoxin HigA
MEKPTRKKLTNNEDYQLALKRLEVIFDAPNGTQESDEAGELSILIEEYENEHFPF